MEEIINKIKSGIKQAMALDKNFHVYIHGKSDKLEFSEDKKGKYIKIYYNEIKL